MSLKNPADMYVGMLESQTIANQVITRLNLQSVYKTKKMQDARMILKSHTKIEGSKDGLIHVSVKDHSAQRASDIANGYVDSLYDMNSTLTVSEAAHRRAFFDQQLADEKNALASAEAMLKGTQERTGLIQLSGQAALTIESIARVQSQIDLAEVRVQALRTYETDQNQDVILVNEQIATLRRQLQSLENSRQTTQVGDTQISAGRVPAEGLEYERNLREVKYHQTLVDILSRQFEAARIDEAKSAPIIQVIDRATPPDYKSGPPKLLIVLAFGLFGFAASCSFAVIRFFVHEKEQSKAQALTPSFPQC